MKTIITLALAMLFAIPSFANISVSPPSIFFGNVKVGSYGFQRSVTVRNQGNKTVNVQVSGYCGGDFRVSNSCYSLSQYGSCNINVEFRPTREGNHSCSVNVRDSEGSGTYVNVNGYGTKN